MKKIFLTSIIGISMAASANAGIIGWDNQYVTAGLSGGVGSGTTTVSLGDYMSGMGYSVDIDESFFGFNVGYGAYLQDNIRTEFDFEYKSIESKTDIVMEGERIDKANDRDSLFLVTANIFADIDMGYKIVPYFGFGIGAGYLYADINSIENFNNDDLDISSFAYSTSFMLGLSYEISDSWTLGLEYKNMKVYGDFDANLDMVKFDYENSALHEFKLSARYTF